MSSGGIECNVIFMSSGGIECNVIFMSSGGIECHVILCHQVALNDGIQCHRMTKKSHGFNAT
jgi:hypothetical protein